MSRGNSHSVYQLGHAWPQRSGDKRERCAENEDSDIGHDDSAYLIALELGQNEGEGKVAGDKQQ